MDAICNWSGPNVDDFDDAYDPSVKRSNLPNGVELYEADLRAATPAWFHGIDLVFHLAARAGVRASLGDPGLYAAVNVEGTARVLGAAARAGGPPLVFASSSSVSFVSQDGSAPGELANVRVEDDGTILGIFTNGVSQSLGQVALATFNAPDQLSRDGGNLFIVSSDSGQANIGAAGGGGRGRIIGGALEQSNVDVGDELVRMIIAQRSFQANSKVVSTADTLLGELINLKR
jgi:flagellar hook-basal body protein